MTHFKTALLIANRNAKQGDASLSEAIASLRQSGIELIDAPSTKPESLPDLIRQYHNRVDLVIIGGGDGTLNAAAAGLVDTHLPLAILPMGTANDLARTLTIPDDLSQACQVITTGQLHPIDLGWVNGKYFFNVASFGLSADITQRLTKQKKQRWGMAAYAITALPALWQAQPFSAEIRYAQQTVTVKTLQIAIGNGRYYGGGMQVSAEAMIDDHQLDLYSLEIQQGWQLLSLLPDMLRGRHIELPNVRSLRGQEFEVKTDRPYPINTDGELTTQTPAVFRLVPDAIRVLVPANVSADTLVSSATH
ncbi:lipid kinase [Oculatella sp. LEGE 06141]|uniref:lipid kinase n=1 Tax=Oculatella sp. LEGE 06141 TaxID=1828648 RepID=UPI0018818534|nr:lipid kinase [Oculatella sp. LEGE 06141]MBE9177189.1 lipid kinase [Oculatella sp. LEGE 06141]